MAKKPNPFTSVPSDDEDTIDVRKAVEGRMAKSKQLVRMGFNFKFNNPTLDDEDVFREMQTKIFEMRQRYNLSGKEIFIKAIRLAHKQMRIDKAI